DDLRHRVFVDGALRADGARGRVGHGAADGSLADVAGAQRADAAAALAVQNLHALRAEAAAAATAQTERAQARIPDRRFADAPRDFVVLPVFLARRIAHLVARREDVFERGAGRGDLLHHLDRLLHVGRRSDLRLLFLLLDLRLLLLLLLHLFDLLFDLL